jgi:hypothetical protein
MRNLICGLVAVFALMAGSAQAQQSSCDQIAIRGLSDTKIQEMRLTCQQMLLDATQTVLPTSTITENLTDPNKLSEWGVVAQEWAKALGLAAKELGLAVDGFLDTDAGKLTAVVIIWHVMGEQIVGMAFGIPLLIATIVIGLKLARRWRIKQVEYGEPRLWIFFKPVKNIVYSQDDASYVLPAVTYVLTIALSMIIIGSIIF